MSAFVDVFLAFLSKKGVKEAETKRAFEVKPQTELTGHVWCHDIFPLEH
jgi:hypothetical protein